VGTARITVSDTGAGIDMSLLPHVFEPFKESTQGLGPAIVRHLVQMHGGSVTAAVRAEEMGRPSRSRFR
jgi:signal transduction histidine kinase